MNERVYKVEFVNLKEENTNLPLLTELIVAESNSKARQIFKDRMMSNIDAIEYIDYQIASIRLATTSKTLNFETKRGNISIKDANWAIKNLKNGGDVRIEIWKEMQIIRMVPDLEKDNLMRIYISEVWDSSDEIANTIRDALDLKSDIDLEELDTMMMNYGVSDSYEMSWLYAIPDNGRQLIELIEYATSEFRAGNDGIFNKLVNHFRKVR